MPTVLEQLRAVQRDAGLVAPPMHLDDGDDGDDEVRVALPSVKSIGTKTATERIVGRCPDTIREGGGYIKIFPPTMQSIRDLTPEWIEANWTKPSPWCRMEGQPDHPEFEGNLTGVER